MAKVKKVGNQWCVTHDVTGAVLRRNGKAVCFATQSAASKDARETRARVMRKMGRR